MSTPAPQFTPSVPRTGTVSDAASIDSINMKGPCDAMLLVKVNFGISRDPAKYILMQLGDNERSKATLKADFGYIREYVRALQERPRGGPPKP